MLGGGGDDGLMPAVYTIENADGEKQWAAQLVQLGDRPQNFHCRSNLSAAHARNIRECQDPAKDFFARLTSNLIHSDGLIDIEAPRFHAPQRFEVPTATKFLADVVDIGANIEAFAANNAEIDFRVSGRYRSD